MRILVVGGGGREHAICWKLTQDDPDLELFAAPGNPGIAQLARCFPVGAMELGNLVKLALELAADLVVIGPDDPLAAGLADQLRAKGLAVFGPSAAAARIESSKRYAKELMQKHGIPTARFVTYRSTGEALAGISAFGLPVVVKASGLAAGKGVAICHSVAEAAEAINTLFKVAGNELVVEEFMEGEELSVFAICDGERPVFLLSSQDHKRLLAGDLGPNTGGMGAYAPVSIATPTLMRRIEAEIVSPALAALKADAAPFTGLLYAGLMIQPDGSPRVVEFNSRFGDPETQVVLPLMRSSLLPLLLGASRVGGLAGVAAPEFYPECAVTTVMASAGYPRVPSAPALVTLPRALAPQTHLFHAGTSLDGKQQLVASGGRVFAATGVGANMQQALSRSQAAVRSISFEGSQWREDVGWRELQRVRSGVHLAS